jgi:sporulation protein YlmC with PRC-barrel domain
MLTNEIVGKEVIGSNGFKLGTITDTEFDENTWKVNSLEIHLEKDIAEEYNLRHRLRKTKVLIHVDHVQAVGERVILKGAREDLLKLLGSAAQAPEEEQQKEERGQMPAAATASTEIPEPIKS